MNEPITATVRLVVTPEKAGRFTARLESSDEVILHSSRQPLVDGARVLLARGFDPTTPLTMRQQGSPHDSFKPAPIREWAKWTYKESDRDGLQKARWMAPELHQRGQKSGSEPWVAPEGHIPEIHFYGGPAIRHGEAA